LLGYAAEAVDPTIEGWLRCVHPSDVHKVRRALASHVEGVTPDLDIEYRIRHANNTYRWFMTHAAAERGADGRAIRIAGSDSDVTDRKVLDAVTGLPNRTYFTDRVAHAMSRSARLRDTGFAVIVLGIDRFANVRESLGQAFCDELLNILGSRLISCMRPMDTVACLGENLFAIAAEDVRDPGDAVRIVDRLTREAGNPVTLDGEDVFVTIRAGIALAAGYSSPDEILRDATVAMNQARNQGSAVYEVFDPTMHARAMGRLKLESELNRAIQQQQFILHYQPVQDLRTGGLHSFEALVRWRHPDGRLIQPGEFIGLAESTGLIVPIGAWVLEAAAHQLVSWRDSTEKKMDLSVSVNVSGKQLGRGDYFVDTVSRVLKESRIDPQALVLEITESAVMEDVSKAIATLERVKKLGVHLALDDFGTGYSSLSLLDRLPVDLIKIDRAFVRKMADDESKGALVAVVVDLAHRLGLKVVAEGIETEDDMRRLMAMGCEFGQGYYFARPLGAPAARLLIARSLHPQSPETALAV
jgi:diguanylate cyclase (GGDEF)-like protein